MPTPISMGIVVCNYNKAEYLKNAIASILDSDLSNLSYKIIVADNHSTDGSIEYLESLSRENENIFPIFLPENRGGSGGFYAGMKYASEFDFDYVMLCDNDIVLEKSCIKNLVCFLENHKDFGAVGSLIYIMDEPDVIQEYGALIDMDKYNITLLHHKKVAKSLPEYIECDYAAACSLMIRGDVIRQCGIFRNDFFIYWDDIELCYRIKTAGYRIASYSKAVVWHKGNIGYRETTFGPYYFWRNRIRFFLTYLNDQQLDKFLDSFFDEAFKTIYMLNLRKRPNYITSLLIAIEDGFNGVLGKADDKKILPLEPVPDRAMGIIENYKSVYIANKEDYPKIYINLLKKLADSSVYLTDDADSAPGCLTVKLCEHVLDLRQYEEGVLYLDGFLHVVFSRDEFEFLNSYGVLYDFIKGIILPIFKLRASIFRQCNSSANKPLNDGFSV